MPWMVGAKGKGHYFTVLSRARLKALPEQLREELMPCVTPYVAYISQCGLGRRTDAWVMRRGVGRCRACEKALKQHSRLLKREREHEAA